MIVNNVAYSWSMVQLTSSTLAGSANANPEVLQGVSAIKWNIRRNTKVNYGLGGEPVNRGFGNHEYTASITMDYNTQVQLRGERSSLSDIGEFDLIVSFANEMGTENWKTETVTLKGCMFTEDGLEVSQDDTNITKEFDLNVFKIEVSQTATPTPGA